MPRIHCDWWGSSTLETPEKKMRGALSKSGPPPIGMLHKKFTGTWRHPTSEPNGTRALQSTPERRRVTPRYAWLSSSPPKSRVNCGNCSFISINVRIIFIQRNEISINRSILFPWFGKPTVRAYGMAGGACRWTSAAVGGGLAVDLCCWRKCKEMQGWHLHLPDILNSVSVRIEESNALVHYWLTFPSTKCSHEEPKHRKYLFRLDKQIVS